MEQRGIALVRIKKIFTSPLFLLRICMGMRIDSSGNVRIDHQQTTKKKGTILRLSLSNLKVLEVYIKMNSIYIPTILVYMIANCNTYSHFIHRLIHTEKTSKYLFKKAVPTPTFPPLTTPAKIIYQLIFFIWAKE